MLNIYRSRENVEREARIAALIGKKRRECKDANVEGVHHFVIVPDQYTLAAERELLRHLKAKVLMDIEVIGFSRFGGRLLQEAGEDPGIFLDRIGRFLLLTRLLKEKDGEFGVFRGMYRKENFVNTVSDFLATLKQSEITPEDLAASLEQLEDAPLTRKLRDIHVLYAAYEKMLQEGGMRYRDTEDLIALYAKKATDSALVRRSFFWIYGFDSFTPKNLTLLQSLMSGAQGVSVFLTGASDPEREELFSLTEYVTENLRERAARAGVASRIHDDVPSSFFRHPAPGIAYLEENLFRALPRPAKEEETRGITLAEASDPYTEAASAAAFVRRLLLKEGLRKRDICLICNDESRSALIRRVFHESGIDLFADVKRPVLHAPAAVFTHALLQCVRYGCRIQDVMRLLKTGLTELSTDEVERLENYAIQYNVRGNRWKKPFDKGHFQYGEEELAALDKSRGKVARLLEEMQAICERSATVHAFLQAFHDFLADTCLLPAQIDALAKEQAKNGDPEQAQETVQIWTVLMHLFEQLDQLRGAERFAVEEMAELLEAGLSQTQIGVIPPTVDDLPIGTMQRTRIPNVQAMLVLGANEGVLPVNREEDVLFSPEEWDALNRRDAKWGALAGVQAREEALAIYRNLSKPAVHLWISYAASDLSGEEARPSEIMEEVRALFPSVPLHPKWEEEPLIRKIGGRINTLRLFAEACGKTRGMRRGGGEEPAAGSAARIRNAAPERDRKPARDMQDAESAREAVRDARDTEITPHAQPAREAETERTEEEKATWRAVLAYFKENAPADPLPHAIIEGARFDNVQAPLPAPLVRGLYADGGRTVPSARDGAPRGGMPEGYAAQSTAADALPLRPASANANLAASPARGVPLIFSCSPSRIDQYANCPFAHFVRYGLRPQERRLFTLAPREFGDLYHAVLMEVSEKLTETGVWADPPDETLRTLIAEAVERQAAGYRDGVFLIDGGARYWKERVRQILFHVLRALIYQARAGHILQSRFETGFGVGRDIPPVEVDTAAGRVRIEGKIDRLDYLPGERIRIMDYKTGKRQFSMDEAKQGYNLQLMLYLKAAQEGKFRPAGVFYFLIREPDLDAAEGESLPPEKEERELHKIYKLNGVAVNDPTVIDDLTGGEGWLRQYSDILPITRKAVKKKGPAKPAEEKQYEYAGGLTDEEFRAAQGAVDQAVQRICADLAGGRIDIHPKKKKGGGENKTACTYCEYRSICRFDLGYAGCTYDYLK